MEQNAPMPVNSDFTPGNWLVDSGCRLVAVIDLEDMFYGLRIDPFIRLEADYFPTNPHFREAFLEGFGRLDVHAHTAAREGKSGLLTGGVGSSRG